MAMKESLMETVALVQGFPVTLVKAVPSVRTAAQSRVT